MNKLSGYKEFTLQSGRKVEIKFSNATTEIYAGLMGFDTIDQVSQSLMLPLVDGVDESGEAVKVPQLTAAYLKALRLYTYAAAKYAALAQNKPVDFNEWEVAEWIEEIGSKAILDTIEQPSEAQVKDAKKKNKPAKS